MEIAINTTAENLHAFIEAVEKLNLGTEITVKGINADTYFELNQAVNKWMREDDEESLYIEPDKRDSIVFKMKGSTFTFAL